MAALTLRDSIEAGNDLGEGALWHAPTRTLWWTDIEGREICRWNPAQRRLIRTPAPERLGSFAFTPDPGTLLAAFESGIALWQPESGTLEWWLKPNFPRPRMRFNDGHTDRQGRFWAGTMTEGAGPIGESYPRNGQLYCIRPDGRISSHQEALAITNAIAASPDGRTLYFADSARQTIFACALDTESGRLSDQRVFARTRGAAQPDGATTDAEGCLWNAEWDGGDIVRYAPDGRVIGRFPLPVSRPTSLAFGGDGNTLLFVTSARNGLSETALMRQPMAGNVLVYETDVAGIGDAEFA